MERLQSVLMLGDSILKGVQVDPATKKYITKNDMGQEALAADFALKMQNQSHFGATCVKGGRLLERILARQPGYDAVVMDFGGNDCDYAWAEIAADPAGDHVPHVPLAEFVERYRTMVRQIREAGMEPVLTTLPPLIPQRFFDWWCGGLDGDAIRGWMGDVCNIYAHQERYSHAVEEVAKSEGAALVDIRRAFLENGRIDSLMCEDGTHPNSAGQALIGQALREFFRQRQALAMGCA